MTWSATVRKLKQDYIRAALEENGYDKNATARSLGIGRTHFHDLLTSLGLRNKRRSERIYARPRGIRVLGVQL